MREDRGPTTTWQPPCLLHPSNDVSQRCFPPALGGEEHVLFLVPHNNNGAYRELGKCSKKQHLQGFWSRSKSEEGTLGMNIRQLSILCLAQLDTLCM